MTAPGVEPVGGGSGARASAGRGRRLNAESISRPIHVLGGASWLCWHLCRWFTKHRPQGRIFEGPDREWKSLEMLRECWCGSYYYSYGKAPE